MIWHRLKAELHVSWLAAGWCLGAVVGVIAVARVPYGLFADWTWLAGGVSLIAPTIFWRPTRRWMMILMLASGMMIGLWRGSLGQVGLEKYQALYGKELTVKGKVSEDPDVDKHDNSVLRLSGITIFDERLPGNIWVSISRSDVIKRSDVVMVKGKLSGGFGSFAGKMVRAKVVNVERLTPGDVAVGVRDWFSERVRRYLPDNESALGLGFLLGLRRALPQDLLVALQIAGLTHVIVASGYNLTILVRLARRLFVRISKYLSALSATIMILGFMAITGLSPSMSRAGLVAGLSLAAWYYGRAIHPLVLLPVSAAITLLINPSFGWNDLGWQLSFAAFAGVIILAPLLHRYFYGRKEPGAVRQIFGETLSAQIMTLPLLIGSFGIVSNVALISNMLILPFVPLAMLLIFLVGILADVPFVAGIIATPLDWLLHYMVMVTQWLAAQDWAQMKLELPWWGVAVSYVVLGIAMWWMRRQTGFKMRQVNIVK